MNNEINLLYSKKQLQLNQLTTKVRLMRFIALGLLFLICGISIVFFLFVIASPLSSLKAQEASLTKDLSVSQDKIAKQTLLVTRLSDINTITTKRSQYDVVLKTIMDTLPAGTTIEEFAGEKNVIEIQVTSTSLDDIEKCFSNLKVLVQNKNTFSQVFMSTLTAAAGDNGEISNFESKLILTTF